MKKSALIIFVRNPEPGKVKTRLAKTIGHEKTLVIYTKLLEHTCSITKNLECDKFIFYADYIGVEDTWDKNIYHKKLQHGEDLGKKMENAFLKLHNDGYTHIIIIGSDCYELTENKIINAFDRLDSNKIIIGPATDGGYYLLGLTEMVPELFVNVSWSTPNVLKETIDVLESLNNGFVLLDALNDIDEEADLTDDLRAKAGLTLHLK
jgi:rSAM/selenodomain-associated transferase 1